MTATTNNALRKKARAAKKKYEEECKVARLVLILMVNYFVSRSGSRMGGEDALEAQKKES